ncbi:MAG: efflux transporter outer membrane subunit [Gammaproteobacteria bacterium]
MRSLILYIVLSAALTGCMVGPDFHSPRPPNPETYTGYPKPVKTVSISSAGNAGKAQHFISGRDIPSAWWTLFHSPELNNLILKGIANSPNLAAAKAALREAQENFYAQFASTMIPNITGQLSAERQRFSAETFGLSSGNKLFNLYNASVNTTYILDIFGGQRRALESYCAQVNYQRFEMEAAYLTLTANIVTTAFTIASYLAQIEATYEIINAQVNQLQITQKQFNLGGASRNDVLAQEAQVAQVRATLPPLQQNLAINLHALSVLIGALPNENELPKLNLNHFNLPTQLPISIPSRLVRQRPDIQASEALLHAASAQIGVATANLYPQLTINAAYGRESLTPHTLFKPDNAVWNVTGTLLQPIFNAGALRAKRRAAIDAFEQAFGQYRQAVLQGFQNVADTLRALEHDAKELQAQKQAEVSAQQSLVLTTKQYRLGAVTYLALLTAQRQYQQARLGRIQAQAARYTDTAALFQALGGGWWNRTRDHAVNAIDPTCIK